MRRGVQSLSILVDENTKILVYGMTGNYGSAQVKAMLTAGSNIVAGVSVGKGGQEHMGIPICDTALEAVEKYGANTGIIYVPSAGAKSALIEAIEAGVKVVFCPTEGIPNLDTIAIRQVADAHDAWFIGPNSLGVISPGKSLVGSIAPAFTKPGAIGVISRSGTVTLAVASCLTDNGLGQSTVISIGGDVIIGKNPLDYIKKFNEDDETKVVVMVGEIGGMKEYEVCEYMPQMKKPLVAFIGGRSAKPGKRMGHMGAMISGSKDDANSKAEALKKAGAVVVGTPWDIPDAIKALGF